MLELNTVLAGRYRLESSIGSGGMATVYRALDLRHDRIVAIKVMKPEYAESIGRDRFLREIRVTAGLSHPHLLALYDSGEIDGLLFYVMPFVNGMSLRDRMRTEGRLPLADVAKITREAAAALSAAHAGGIVHRDIKPENILLSGYVRGADHAQWTTLVADFGISAVTTGAHDHLTATGIAVGSPHYMSPEQALGEQVDARTDIWALGCVAFEMLEGATPRGVPAFRRTGLPQALRAAVLHAIAHDPEKRYGTATKLADAIDRAMPASGRASKPSLWIAAAALVGIAIVGAVGAIMYRRPATIGARPITTDSIALVLYRRGQSSAATRDPNNLGRALDDFSGAIQRDSGFALAWAAMAGTAEFMASRGYVTPTRSRDSLVTVAVNGTARAFSLDSSRADVFLVRARLLEIVDPTNTAQMLRDVHRALALDSTNAQAWLQLGRTSEETLDTAAARAAYEQGLRYAPRFPELLAFVALHCLWTRQPREGMRFVDTASAADPAYALAREVGAALAIELRDWDLAERHLAAYEQMAAGPDRVVPLGHRARLAALRGDLASAKRFAVQAERLVGSRAVTRHQAASLGEAFSAVGDTARALRWLEAYTPRTDAHYQLHLHRDPALEWLHAPRYRHLLVEPIHDAPRP